MLPPNGMGGALGSQVVLGVNGLNGGALTMKENNSYLAPVVGAHSSLGG